MARIQILELPAEREGATSITPFAIIIDQYDEPLSSDEIEIFREFRKECGARYLLVLARTMDVVAVDAEPGHVPVVPYVPRRGHEQAAGKDPLVQAVARIAEEGA